MRLKCPHCHNALNVVDAQPAVDVACPSCGSKFPVGEVTVTYRDTVIDRVGHFEIIEKVGAGHFGTVFRARDAQLNRTVAIKLPRTGEITDQHRAMFLREARAAAGLDHPNIVRVYEIGEEGDQIYIVSQFIDGVTLRDKLQIHRYPPREGAEFLSVIADGIHFAHEHGIVHRDLKPSNILVDHEGRPHISDFGLAKIDSAEVTVTISGVVLGTPAYMSPEQARGDSHSAGPRSDVYSLGVILYEMLTGQRPFDGSTSLLLHQIQSSDPRAPRTIKDSIPRDLETICLKALAKSPDRRYATAKEMADDLRRFIAGESIHARRVSPAERGLRWIRRNRSLTGAAVVAILASAIAIGATLSQPDPKDGIKQLEQLGYKVEVTRPLQVSITTKPEGARIVLYPLDAQTWLPNYHNSIVPEKRTPIKVSLIPGNYKVVATLDDDRFHEVIRHVPSKVAARPVAFNHCKWTNTGTGEISVPNITIPERDAFAEMVSFDGNSTFSVGIAGSASVPEHIQSIEPFLLDSHEVSVSDFTKVRKGQPPVYLIGRADRDAILSHPDEPVTYVVFDEVVHHLEQIGKRLPTEFEYEFAATNRGTTRFPFGDDPPTEDLWKKAPVGQPPFDQTRSNPPVFGLFSNVLEMTSSRYLPYQHGSDLAELVANSGKDQFVVRGGPLRPKAENMDFLSLDVRQRTNVFRDTPSPMIGFRGARSKSPRQFAEGSGTSVAKQ